MTSDNQGNLEESSVVKRMVCLAYSRMPNGRCVAGRELRTDGRLGGWIRPVAGGRDEGVPEEVSGYADGGLPRLLDVMDVPVVVHRPEGHQRENWLLDPGRRWAKLGRFDMNALPKWADAVDSLWLNGFSTSNGLNDKVPAQATGSLNTSLHLIEADLEVSVSNPGAARGDFRRRVQGRFRYNRTDYRMWVTDPDQEQKYFAGPNGTYPIGRCLLTVSLSLAAYYGFHYKLIAAIIEP